MSIMETGFTSKEQEYYIMTNNPTLYKKVLNKHGHYSPYKKNTNSKPQTTQTTGLNQKVKSVFKGE